MISRPAKERPCVMFTLVVSCQMLLEPAAELDLGIWLSTSPFQTQVCLSKVSSKVPYGGGVSRLPWLYDRKGWKQNNPRKNRTKQNFVSLRTARRWTVSNQLHYCLSHDVKGLLAVGEKSQGLSHGKQGSSPAVGLCWVWEHWIWCCLLYLLLIRNKTLDGAIQLAALRMLPQLVSAGCL